MMPAGGEFKEKLRDVDQDFMKFEIMIVLHSFSLCCS